MQIQIPGDVMAVVWRWEEHQVVSGACSSLEGLEEGVHRSPYLGLLLP